MNLGKAVELPFFNAEAQRGRRNAEKGFRLAGYAKFLHFSVPPQASPLRLCVEMRFFRLTELLWPAWRGIFCGVVDVNVS